MQERQKSQLFCNKQIGAESNQQPELITIDQKWVVNSPFLKIELITCPVCYSIPLDYPKQCAKCQRIFCHMDYQIISNNGNRCPNCKQQNWPIKKQIHLAYKHMFDSLVFRCILCKDSPHMKSNHLISHLQNVHNKYLSDQSILYDYTFIGQKGQESHLNLTQNIQMNFKKNQGMLKFEIAGIEGRVLTVDLKDWSASHPQLGKCKIMKRKSRTIKKHHQYMLWIVNISDPEEPEQRMVFYSEQLQTLLQKNYHDFEKNERFNEFCMDVRDTRYRISFNNKTQTNTFTRIQKTIMRVPITFR